MSQATGKMIDDLDNEIDRLECEIAERDEAVRQWKERAEKAERVGLGDWAFYTGFNVAAILVGLLAGVCLCDFIRWAAQP